MNSNTENQQRKRYFSELLQQYKAESPQDYQSLVDFFRNNNSQLNSDVINKIFTKEVASDVLNLKYSVAAIESGYDQACSNLEPHPTVNQADIYYSAIHHMIEVLGGIEEFIKIDNKINIISDALKSNTQFSEYYKKVVNDPSQNIFSSSAIEGMKDIITVHNAAVTDQYLKEHHPSLHKFVSKLPTNTISSPSLENSISEPSIENDVLYFR